MTRPWTPNTATLLTVKRCCNGCQRPIGDATDAEMDAAVAGRALPDVRKECGCLATTTDVANQHITTSEQVSGA